MQIAQALRQTTKPFVSLEFFPPAAESHLPEFYETVERLRSIDPLFLSVTYGAGGGKQQNTLNVTAELARRGFTVMAHLTCVGAEPQAISDFLPYFFRFGPPKKIRVGPQQFGHLTEYTGRTGIDGHVHRAAHRGVGGKAGSGV